MRDALLASGLRGAVPALDWRRADVGVWGRAAAPGSSCCATATASSCAGPCRSIPKVARRERFRAAGRARRRAVREAPPGRQGRVTERRGRYLQSRGDDAVEALGSRPRAGASSRISRSPLALMRATRMPAVEGGLALPGARLQFSALALADLLRPRPSSSRPSASSACLRLFFEFLVDAGRLGRAGGRRGRAGAAAAAAAASACGGVGGTRCCGAGWRRMFLSGTSGGGAWSLKTLRPSLSTHCHWARGEQRAAAQATGEERGRGTVSCAPV